MMQVDGYIETEFKDTEIGPIPVEWEVKKLSEITVKTRQRNPGLRPNEEFQYIDVSSVSNETNTVVAHSKILGNEAPSRARKVVQADDTIFATVRPYLRNIAQIPDELDGAICSTGFCVIRANLNIADPNFLFHTVLLDSFIDQVVGLQRGSSYPAVSDKDLKAQLIPLPPLPEQQRIAAVLNAIQDEIAAQDDIIAEAREFKRSLMQRLFTYGPGPEPAATKETEIGEIPAHWEVSTLGDLGHWKGGSTPSKLQKSYWDNGTISWASPKDIVGEYLRQTEDKLTDMAVKRSGLHLFPPNSVIVVFRSGILRKMLPVALSQITFTVNQDLKALTPHKNRNNAFICFWLQYKSSQILGMAVRQGTTVQSLDTHTFYQIAIGLPPLNEQEHIAARLSDIDVKIAIEEDRKTALQDFFRTTLHQLMSGQIRLLSDEGLSL